MLETSWRDRWVCLPAFLGDRPEARAAPTSPGPRSRRPATTARYEVGLTQDELRGHLAHGPELPDGRARGARVTSRRMAPQPIALVLAGGGARGAYEAGALSALLPALPEDAAPEHRSSARASARSTAPTWPRRCPTAATRALAGRALDLGADPLGRRAGHAVAARPRPARPRRADLHRPALLAHPRAARRQPAQAHARAPDPVRPRSPTTSRTAAARRRGRRHVRAHRPQRRLPLRRHAGRGPRRQARDRLRRRPRSPSSTCAPPRRSPRSFPAVEIKGGPGAGWYFDGGTRLNAPIKPALSLGAERVIVVGAELDRARAGPARRARAAGPVRRRRARDRRAARRPAGRGHPDAHHDQPARGRSSAAGHRQVPYIFIAPPARDTIGEIAHDVFRRHYGGLLHAPAHRSSRSSAG